MNKGVIGKKKTLVGSVIRANTPHTVMVSVERLAAHPVYGKFLKRHVRYMAHDEKGVCAVGDRVALVETRPLSRLKRWRIKGVLEKAK